MKVCVVIKNYNFNDMTRECVASVRKNAGIEHDILVVDSGSDNNYIDESCEILRLEKNEGYTNAVNQSIIWCDNKYDYIMQLDNDTIVCPDFLKYLVKAMESDKKIAVASSARVTNGVQELCGADLVRGHQRTLTNGSEEGVRECVWVPGCAMMLRNNVIREIGMFDKRMINHCSDNDWCYRAITYGYKIVYVPESKVNHMRSTTTKKYGVMPYKDQRIMLEKLSGLQYQQILNTLPMDAESNAWGKINFVMYRK